MLTGPNGKTAGLEKADSITLDAHKWLNVPYDCGIFLTRHRQHLVAACDVPAPYLVSSDDEPDFMSLGIENSRRFRALPIWMSLLAYGREGVSHWVEKNINQAKRLADWIDASDDYELVYPCQLNVVLFRPTAKGLTAEAADQQTKTLLSKINQDGRIFLSPGAWQGKGIIRAALSNWQTEQADVDIAIEVLSQLASN
jgi:glutamate/tyrosine decarboxylase-like PLP-dependent enzyme